MELQKKTVEWNVWRFAFLDQELEAFAAPLQGSDYELGPFNEERLGEYAPDCYLADWCPPPPALMESEMQDFLDWVESEADKGDLYPDSATYPFDDYLDREDLYVCKFWTFEGKRERPCDLRTKRPFFASADPCAACANPGTGGGLPERA